METKPKILVAYKKSRYQQVIEFLEENNGRKEECKHCNTHIHDFLPHSLNEDTLLDPSNYESLKGPDSIHKKNLEQVIDILDNFHCDFEVKYRGDVKKVDKVDLVITVGGDGTVLDMSHKVESQPLLGINSNPSSSVGYFCAGVADVLPKLLDDIFSNKIKPLELMRTSVEINGKRVDLPILNDILVANENPAAVSTYTIQIGDQEPEFQKSSGIWISTPSGSTAAIRSAGGYIQPLSSRNIQYLVREPCQQPDRMFRHLKGIRPSGGPFSITSRMRNGRLYLDGPHNCIPFRFADVLTLNAKTPDFRIYQLSNRYRE